MSQKSTAKPASKRKGAAKIQQTSQKMEKDFLNAPVQLVAKLNKEIAVLKQNESKLRTSLAKLKTQKPSDRPKSATTLKSISVLTKQLNDTTKLLASAINSQAKVTAIRKLLTQFTKDWAKQTKIKSKASSAKKTKPSKPTSPKTAYQVPLQQHAENSEPMLDSIKIGSPTENNVLN